MWEVSGKAEDAAKKQSVLTDTGWTDGIEEKRKRGRREAIKGIMSAKAHVAGTEWSRIPLVGSQ